MPPTGSMHTQSAGKLGSDGALHGQLVAAGDEAQVLRYAKVIRKLTDQPILKPSATCRQPAT